MDPCIFFEVLIPLWSVANSAMVLGSTLASRENYFTRFIQLKDGQGRDIVDTHVQTLICERCMKREHPEACRHKMHELPPWKSKENIEMIKLAYSGDKKNMMREILCVL